MINTIASVGNTMDFQYSTLWRRLQRFPATEDIVVTLFTADYVAMKNQRRECVPFLTRNMTSCKVDDPAITAFPLYDNGMYVVYERAALPVLAQEVVDAGWNWDTFVIPNDDSE